MNSNWNKILCLSPHTDDGELGCGGTIAKLLKENKEVYYVGFAYPIGCPRGTLKSETREAMRVFGLPKDNLILLNYPTRHFPQHRQKILDEMVELNRKLKPDLIFLPSTYDTHQDHQVISQEGFRAFKKASILGYEEPWNNLNFSTEVFSVLSENDIQKKIKALACYKSQSARPFISADFVNSLAKTRGIQVGTQYAEAFMTLRILI